MFKQWYRIYENCIELGHCSIATNKFVFMTQIPKNKIEHFFKTELKNTYKCKTAKPAVTRA